jgi:hypothetical protein
MELYRNTGGNSGVHSFKISENSIIVNFNDGASYLYNNISAGENNIIIMKNLAIKGKGLNSFINIDVKKRYLKKIS